MCFVMLSKGCWKCKFNSSQISLKEKYTLISNMHCNLFKLFFLSFFSLLALTLSIFVYLCMCLCINNITQDEKKQHQTTNKQTKKIEEMGKEMVPIVFSHYIAILIVVVVVVGAVVICVVHIFIYINIQFIQFRKFDSCVGRKRCTYFHTNVNKSSYVCVCILCERWEWNFLNVSLCEFHRIRKIPNKAGARKRAGGW